MSNIMKLRKNIFAVYVVTVVFASILVNILLKLNIDMNYLSIDIYEIISVHKSNMFDVFLYLFIERGKQLIVIYLLSKVINPNILQNIIIVLLMFCLGVFLTIQTFYYGFAGILILLASIFPQYFVYIFLVKYLCQRFNGEKYNKNKYVYYVNVTLLLLLGVVLEEIFLIFFLGDIQQYIVLRI